MDQRRADPRDDFTTRLVECDPADGSFDDEIRLNMMSQLIGAGNDTTSKALADATVRLAGDPAMAERLRSDPSLVPAYMEEVVRLLSPTQGLYRTASRDTELAGVTHPGGQRGARELRVGQPHRVALRLCRRRGARQAASAEPPRVQQGQALLRRRLTGRVLMTEAMLVLLERFGGWTIDDEAGGAHANQSYLLAASTSSGSGSSRPASPRG